MKLNEELWDVIDAIPKLSAEAKKTLLVEILRVIEASKTTESVTKPLGVTVMTQEASLAGDKVARDRSVKQLPGDARPKTI